MLGEELGDLEGLVSRKTVVLDPKTQEMLKILVDKYKAPLVAKEVKCDESTISRYLNLDLNLDNKNIQLDKFINIHLLYYRYYESEESWPNFIQKHNIIMFTIVNSEDDSAVMEAYKHPLYNAIARIIPDSPSDDREKVLEYAGWHSILASLNGRYANHLLKIRKIDHRKKGYNCIDNALRHVNICTKLLSWYGASEELQAYGRNQRAVILEYGAKGFIDDDKKIGRKREDFYITYTDDDLQDRYTLLKNRQKGHPGLWNAAANLFCAGSMRENGEAVDIAWYRLCDADLLFKENGPSYKPIGWTGLSLAEDEKMSWGCNRVWPPVTCMQECVMEEKSDSFEGQSLGNSDRPIVYDRLD